jgi:hypothetical protein
LLWLGGAAAPEALPVRKQMLPASSQTKRQQLLVAKPMRGITGNDPTNSR